MLSDNYTYKNQKKIRINIFLAYILANHSIKNDRPSSHYCSYDQDFNELNKNNRLNSTFNGISITVDMLDTNPNKIRLFTLRSFGESLYHSITDSSLEFGYKSI